jgi:hypothetical protein
VRGVSKGGLGRIQGVGVGDLLVSKFKFLVNQRYAVLGLNGSQVRTMTKCLGPHHGFDDFTTYDLTTFTTS